MCVQVLVLLFGLAAIGMAIAGMIKLPKDPFQPPLQTADDALAYVTTVLDAGDQLHQKILSVNGAVDGIQTVLDVHLHASDLTSRLDALQPFLNGLPDPGPIQSGLRATDTLVQGSLIPQLTTLASTLGQLQDSVLPAVSEAGRLPSLLQDISLAASTYTHELGLVQSS